MTSSEEKNQIMHGGIRYLLYVFTEHGVMIFGLLKSDIAVRVNIQIINAFVEMRKYIATNNYERRISNVETKLIDYDKYKGQYNNVNIMISNSFHDRFMIIDDKALYHCGASFKDLGKKCVINKIEDKKILLDLSIKINLIK